MPRYASRPNLPKQGNVCCVHLYLNEVLFVAAQFSFTTSQFFPQFRNFHVLGFP